MTEHKIRNARDTWLPGGDQLVEHHRLIPVAEDAPVQVPATEIGSGFSWGKAGPNAHIRRNGAELVFGVGQKAPWVFE